MNIRHERKKDTLIAVLEGELDHHQAGTVRDRLDRILDDEGIKNLILDLRSLTFMDSSGIGVFIGRYKRINKRGGIVAFAAVHPQAHKLLEVSGLYTIIQMHADVESARRAVQGVS